MLIDEKHLYRFEAGLNPQNLSDASIPATVIGYGEISTIFQIGDYPEVAFKRMPLFSDRFSAEQYLRQYREYCHLLMEAGLNLPGDDTAIIMIPNRPVVLYIAQQKLSSDGFGHHRIHACEQSEASALIQRIVSELSKIWAFNHTRAPALELAIDGQISNWFMGQDMTSELVYVDTSTPFYRKQGIEQLNPELLLRSAPPFLRWILRLFFLQDVMNRYYDPRMVYTDLVANLYKEQRPDLVEMAVEIVNRHLNNDVKPLTVKSVEKYYKEDKLIWTLFLAFRRMDQWLTTTLLRKRYEFILPEKITR